MLQNLLGLSVSGLSAPLDGGDGAVRESALALDSGSGSFDKLLKNNDSTVLGGEGVALASFSVPDPTQAEVLPGEQLAELRLALKELVELLQANGIALPQSGSELPQLLPPLEAIAAELGSLADLVASTSTAEALPLQRVQELVAGLQNLLPGLVTNAAIAGADSAPPGTLPRLEQGISPVDGLAVSNGIGLPTPGELAKPALATALAFSLQSQVEAQVQGQPQARQSQMLTEQGLQQGLQQRGSQALVAPAQLRQQLGSAIQRLATALVQGGPAANAQGGNSLSAAAATLAAGQPDKAAGNARVLSPALLATAAAPGLNSLPDVASTNAALQSQVFAASQLTASQASSLSAALQAAVAGAPAQGALPVNAALQGSGANGLNFASLLPAASPVADTSLIAALAAAQDATAGPAQLAASTLAASIGAAKAAPPTPMASIFSTEVALPVMSSHWGQQLTQRLGWLAGQGIHSADIQLNPPELGPIQVRIDSADNAARVTISVHSSVTREAMEAQIPRLRDLFAEQGLDLVDVNVDSGDFADQQQADEMLAEDGEQGRQREQEGDVLASGEELAAAEDLQRAADSLEPGALQHIVLRYAVNTYA